MRATVPGGEKALVISKFDALGQKTDQLIPTLYHGGIWWSGFDGPGSMENADDDVVSEPIDGRMMDDVECDSVGVEGRMRLWGGLNCDCCCVGLSFK